MAEGTSVLIMTDLEGVGGVTSWATCDPRDTTGAFREASGRLVGEINAAAEAAFDAGAEEVVIVEGHKGTFRGHQNQFDQRAKLALGVAFYEIAQEGFDCLMLVGFHAMADAERGVLSHSYANKTYVASWLNGTRVGEIGHLASLFGEYKTPLVFVAGDQAACREAEDLVEGVVTAPVKEGYHRFGAVSLSPQAAQELIREKAREALSVADDITALRFEPPIEFVVEFSSTDPVERSSLVPGIEAAGARRMVIRGDSVNEVMNLFNLTARIV
ncbi:MAG: M55 family metallopeptidase [Planctomycetes bacterium]|nr:M55 family metallopeptidase [Planctomycetota bacterium]